MSTLRHIEYIVRAAAVHILGIEVVKVPKLRKLTRYRAGMVRFLGVEIDVLKCQFVKLPKLHKLTSQKPQVIGLVWSTGS